MKKLIAVVLLLLLCMSITAAPAWAQRDPFDPALDSGEVEPGSEEPGTEEPQAEEPEEEPPAEPTDGGLGNTGLETQPWLVLAYVLISVGAGAVVLGRVGSNQP